MNFRAIFSALLLTLIVNISSAQPNPLARTLWKVVSVDTAENILLQKQHWVGKDVKINFNFLRFADPGNYSYGSKCFGSGGPYKIIDDSTLSLTAMDAVMSTDCDEPRSITGRYVFKITANELKLLPAKEEYIDGVSIAELPDSVQMISTISADDISFTPYTVNLPDGFYKVIHRNNIQPEKTVLARVPSLSTHDIADAIIGFDNLQRPEVSIILTSAGAGKFAKLTAENVSKSIAIVTGKKVIAMPVINEAITDGKVSISGWLSLQEITEIADKLKKK